MVQLYWEIEKSDDPFRFITQFVMASALSFDFNLWGKKTSNCLVMGGCYLLISRNRALLFANKTLVKLMVRERDARRNGLVFG